MVKKKIYECKLCNLCTHLKTDFTRHQITKKHKIRVKMDEELKLNIKKNPIVNMNVNMNSPNVNMNVNMNSPNVNMNSSDYKCKYCFKVFKYRQSRSRHELMYCSKTSNNVEQNKISISTDESNEAKLSKYIKVIEKENELIKKEKVIIQKEKKAMRKEIEKLIDKVGNNTTNNIMNNTINIVAPNNFTQENLDYLTGDYLDGLLKIPYGSILDLLRHIHFNPNHPENHNIKIPNRKEKFAIVYSEGKWELRVKKEVIGDMVDTAYNIIDCHYDEVKNTLEFGRKDRFNNYQSSYDTDNKTRQKIETDVELVILNEKETETFKLMST